MTIDADALARLGLRVKPLEWKYDEKRDMWTADGVFGTAYTVSDSQWFRADASEWVWVDGGNEAAKAVAQADYEAHIRSALTAPMKRRRPTMGDRCADCVHWACGYRLQGMKVPDFCSRHFHSQHGDDPACDQFDLKDAPITPVRSEATK